MFQSCDAQNGLVLHGKIQSPLSAAPVILLVFLCITRQKLCLYYLFIYHSKYINMHCQYTLSSLHSPHSNNSSKKNTLLNILNTEATTTSAALFTSHYMRNCIFFCLPAFFTLRPKHLSLHVYGGKVHSVLSPRCAPLADQFVPFLQVISSFYVSVTKIFILELKVWEILKTDTSYFRGLSSLSSFFSLVRLLVYLYGKNVGGRLLCLRHKEFRIQCFIQGNLRQGGFEHWPCSPQFMKRRSACILYVFMSSSHFYMVLDLHHVSHLTCSHISHVVISQCRLPTAGKNKQAAERQHRWGSAERPGSFIFVGDLWRRTNWKENIMIQLILKLVWLIHKWRYRCCFCSHVWTWKINKLQQFRFSSYHTNHEKSAPENLWWAIQIQTTPPDQRNHKGTFSNLGVSPSVNM